LDYGDGTMKRQGLGQSDQPEEQIMRSAIYTFAAALLATACQFSIANAQTPLAQPPQTETPDNRSDAPATPTVEPAGPALSIPDQKLDAAAAAIQRVAALRRDYIRVVNEASAAIEKAVTDQGLSLEEYTTILEQAQKDPQVREKITERIQAVSE
jgi:hypothetical protein